MFMVLVQSKVLFFEAASPLIVWKSMRPVLLTRCVIILRVVLFIVMFLIIV